ncbi:MAG: cupin domain-containing protein [Sedimentisphaerales bacterium]|nr:cupin domain-containing protein [Sedimentisphaerales bacterium]
MENTPLLLTLKDNDEYQPLLEGKPATQGMRSGRVVLKKGENCGEHSTGAHEEQLVFLSGSGTAFLGNEKKESKVNKGNILYIPPFTLHDIHNTASELLTYIYCVAPVAIDEPQK